MNALLILIPVSLLLMGGAVAIFFWAVRHDQFQDLDTPGILPLLDTDPANDAAPDIDTNPESAATDTLHHDLAAEDKAATRKQRP
jgi:cbb3-type cytochrome oxidase maturation protein